MEHINSSQKSLTQVTDYWVYLTWSDKIEVVIEVVGRVAVLKIAKMPRRKKFPLFVGVGLVAGASFTAFALSTRGASTLQEIMVAFAFGLLLGSVLAYFLLRR